jgi:CBS domain-containing protein
MSSFATYVIGSKKKMLGAVVVTDDDVTLLGIISERDIVRGLRTIGDNVLEASLFDPIHGWRVRAIP